VNLLTGHAAVVINLQDLRSDPVSELCKKLVMLYFVVT